jgi:predicted nucleotide-binding protein
MARKTAQSRQEEPPLYLAMPRDEAAAKLVERMDRGKELKDRTIRSPGELQEVKHSYFTWDEYNEELLRRMFSSSKMAEEYRGFAFGSSGSPHLEQQAAEIHNDIDSAIRRLASIKDRLELIPHAPGVDQPREVARRTASIGGSEVFLVHGHDEGVREGVARFIAKLDLTPVILHEQPSQGRTVVEKLDHHGDVGFAVILLTPDDIGGTNPNDLRSRARQNVVLELGFFLGRLGRDRVCAIHRGDLELPSDYMGVIYIPFDAGGGWRLHLARELKAAGFSVDMNKAL